MKILGWDQWRRDPIVTTLFVGLVRKKSNQNCSHCEVRLFYPEAEP